MTTLTAKRKKEDGKRFSTVSLPVLTVVISSDSRIDYDQWNPASHNPNLTTELIDMMFDKMAVDEKEDTATQKANPRNQNLLNVIRKRNSSRSLTRGQLHKHKNLSDVRINASIDGNTNIAFLLDNRSLSLKHVERIFDEIVMNKSGTYNTFLLDQIIGNKLVTGQLLSKWYATLVKYADWSYGSDTEWKRVIEIFLFRPECPIEVLKGAASAPFNTGASTYLERNRNTAVEHKNATPEISMLAYEATNDEKYLPKEARDIFLF